MAWPPPPKSELLPLIWLTPNQIESIESRIHKPDNDPDACWIWRGSFHMGAPSINFTGYKRSNPIPVWARVLGYLPEDAKSHAVCGNVRCANPRHRRIKAIPARAGRILTRPDAPRIDREDFTASWWRTDRALDPGERRRALEECSTRPYLLQGGKPVRVDRDGDVWVWNRARHSFVRVYGFEGRINLGGIGQHPLRYVVCTAWWGWRARGTKITHADGDRENNHPLNLEWGDGGPGMYWPEKLQLEALRYWDKWYKETE